jgi:hypothetical protein
MVGPFSLLESGYRQKKPMQGSYSMEDDVFGGRTIHCTGPRWSTGSQSMNHGVDPSSSFDTPAGQWIHLVGVGIEIFGVFIIVAGIIGPAGSSIGVRFRLATTATESALGARFYSAWKFWSRRHRQDNRDRAYVREPRSPRWSCGLKHRFPNLPWEGMVCAAELQSLEAA